MFKETQNLQHLSFWSKLQNRFYLGSALHNGHYQLLSWWSLSYCGREAGAYFKYLLL